jgi:pimeloyl-ACP methyl ester carboxylesterase
MKKVQVIAIPGSVAPAAQRYRPLLELASDRADFHLKDLEVYREATPPADYSIDEEVDAIDRFADAQGLDRFHLVAYSGGGFISLAYAASRPRRVISLAVFEPARLPGELGAEERAFFSVLETRLRGLQGPEFMAAFVREQVKPGVTPTPPSGPATPEMQKRPAGIAALIRAFDAYPFDRGLLSKLPFPVYYAYGDLSHEEQALKAGILGRSVPDIRIQRFAGVHHFVPPEQIYTASHVSALSELWQRAEESAAQPSHQ